MKIKYAFVLFYRSLVTQLAAPKIPEGERVDFDVGSFKIVVNTAQRTQRWDKTQNSIR